MRKRIEAVARRVSSKTVSGGGPTAFWEVWDDPLMTAGGPTFISEAISAAGGRNVFADAKEQYPTVSVESVLARNPDWLLSGTDHGAKLNAQALSLRRGWRSLKAVKEGKIALIDADSINRAGPRLADAIEELARVFHPDLFPRRPLP
jgi:iron complex transport system substrate-binding protein